MIAVLSRQGRIAEITRFGGVGLIATASYFLGFVALDATTDLGARYVSLMAYMFGMAVSWLGQSRLTFGRERIARHSLAKFVTTSFAGSLIAIASVVVVHEMMGLPKVAAAIVTCIAVPVASYLAMSLWVFDAGKETR